MKDAILSLIAESVPQAPRQQELAAGGGVAEFVAQNAPLARQVGAQIGVAPEVLLGQWGLETGWGRSIIPGTNNLGNIKDLSGRGPAATDNMTGSRDSYRAYASPEEFGGDFASLIGRRYAGATNAGADAGRYFSALRQGGYAEDPDYVSKGVAATRAAQAAMPAPAPAPASTTGRYGGPVTEMLDPRAPAPQRSRGILEALNDTVIEAGNAVAGAVKAGADFVAPGNKFSAAIEEFIQSGVEKQSDVVRAEKERLAADMQAAPDVSSEISTMLGYMGRNPALTAAQIAGSFAIPGLAVKGAQRFAGAMGVGAGGASTAGLAAGSAAGAALGGGDAAGTAYDLVMKTPDEVILGSPDAKLLAQQGLDPAAIKEAIAQKAAAQARVLPALLGAVTGLVGAERALAGLPSAAASRLGRAALTGSVEGSTEALEEGVTAYEGQRAAAQYNPEIDPTQGVAGAATMGAVGGLGTGLATGALSEGPLAPVAAKAAEPNSPLSKAAIVGAEATAAAPQPAAPVDPAQRLAELEAIGQSGGIFTPEQQREYEALNGAREATPGAKPDEIGPRVEAVRAAITPSVLDALRAEGVDYTAKDLLKDLAIARSASAQQAQREQALARIETGLEWAGANPAPVVEANIDEITGASQGDLREPGARPAAGQLRAGVDRDAELIAQRDGTQAFNPGQRLLDEAARREEAAALIEEQPGAGPEIVARANQLREQAASLRKAAAQQPAQPATAGATTARDRELVDAQRQTNLEMRLGAPAAAPAPAAPAREAATPADQERLEAAALTGKVAERKREDDPRQVVIDRALRNVEERGGVASPAEAQIFAEAGVGKPYDRIDESLGDTLSTDERLTQATGIALGRRPRENTRQGQQSEADLIAQEQRDRSDSRMEALAAERAARQAQQPSAQPPAGPPAADSVIQALTTIPALRTAEQKAVVDAARRGYTAEQMRVMQDAAVNPANLNATDKLQLQQMRDGQAARSAERQTSAPAETATRAEGQADAEPAVIRKRRRQLDQLAEEGFETVERRDGVFFIRNSRTGEERQLSGRADAALARAAVKAMVDRKANAAATSPQNDRKEPSWAQIDAVNWKKGDPIKLNGVTVRIENPVGSVRSARPDAPVQWKTTMKHHYGEIAGTKGADGDPVDVFVGPNPASSRVWVIDQVNKDGSFDESKVMFGFDSEQAARDGYLSNFEKGWTGLGGIKELTQAEFAAWVKDRQATTAPATDAVEATIDAAPATTPAMAVEPDRAPGATFTVRMGGKNVTFERADVSQLAEQESPERDGKARRISRKAAALISAIGAAMGKRVQFFEDVNGERPGDGFVMPSDPDTVYLNTVSTINPLAVFGHEFQHTLRITNPEAWNAIAAVVRERVKNAKGFRQDYYGSTEAEARGDRALSEEPGGELEELVSDLGGNLMADASFWRDVFAKIDADNGKESKGIIARLIAQLQALLDMAIGAAKGPRFKADRFVDDAASIRAAYRDALAQYLKDKGQSQAGMQAEILKSARRIEREAKLPQTETEAFKRWFGDSKVVDSEGKPLVVYHGTNAKFRAFKPEGGLGVYVTPFERIAQATAISVSDAGGKPSVMSLFASIQNPVLLTQDEIEWIGYDKNRIRELMLQGFDGAWNESRSEILAFKPEQLKSAVGNRGSFDPNDADITRSPERGIHFSKQQRQTINGAYYGTGLKGLEAERLRASDDQRLKTRVYFYVDEGQGVRPEAGVGGVAHEVELPKLYDAKANAERLWNSGDLNGTESRILDAGYHGYFVKNHETGQGLAVVIGDKAKAMPAKPAQPKIAGPVSTGVVETLKAAPSSKELDLINVAAIPGATLRAGMLRLPETSRDMANAEMERIGSPIRFSAERIDADVDEVDAVRQKYEGTDQWLKAPNGRSSNLTERQWLHVRTPSFKAWFGDWEKFANLEGGVWSDDKRAVSKVVDGNGEPLVVYHGTDGGGFAEFNRPTGSGRGDLGIFTTDDLHMAASYVHRGRGRMIGARDIRRDEEADAVPGIYALFVNLRNPAETDFEGANWTGARDGQFMVEDDDGNQLYTDDGQGYFPDRESAFELVIQKGGNIEPAMDHYESTDGVVKDARRSKSDGAIIRRVVDEGGGRSMYAGEPSDLFVAFEPNQVKSADFNEGHYSVDSDDIRFSASRKLERVHEFEVSTRAPSAKPTKSFSPEDAKGSLLISDFAAGLGQEKWLGAVTELVETYPNYRPAATATTPEKKLERMVKQMVENLVWLHDQVPASTRARSKLWYDGARAIAERWVKKYGITDAQAAGMLAVLSPQKDWFMNVSLANRVADIMTERQAFRWSKQMDETANRIFGKEAYQEDIAEIRGQVLQDIEDPYLRAMWLRVYDQAHSPSSFYIVSPEGDFIAEARTKDGALGRVAWGGNSTIAKAVSIFEDGSFDNISEQLGRKHKVRNFYNNILVPNSPNGHVTIDTHAVAAALLRPLSGNSAEVMHNFGGPKSAHAGLEGSYALYEEAYRRAATERGILPREMQSITWEAIRGLFVPTFKSQKKNVDAVDAVWNQFSKGRLSYEKARQQVFELGGRIDPPSWEGRDPGAYVEDEPALDDGDLPEDGVSAGDSEADGRGAGRRAGAAARRSAERGDGDGAGRQEGRGLAPLAGAPAVQGAAGPDPRLVEVARLYAANNGIPLRRQAEYVKVDPERAARIAAAYEAMPHSPTDKKVRAAYEDLIRQTRAQYDALNEAGYKFWFMDPAADPYAGNPWNAMRDLRANQSMAVFPTEAGFGSSELDVADNPLLADTGLRWAYGKPDGEQKRVLANDLFRAVHDAFGHGLEGAGFRAEGEENAWQAHVRLFTGPAVGAITSETRGQNSWLNYGPYGEKNRGAKLEDTVFADQKTGLMPEWTWTEGVAEDATEAPLPPSAAPAALEKIFEDMRGSPKERKAAKAAAEAHPLSAKIQEVESRFLDILEELEGSKALVINCD